eukprot:TRINITY_DN3285_c0_g3_i1.p1 TRINITY_DN3285_c0_g3~~TRINITY_DN3285_c0_g3_i1.p1  ORF type:complete len:112 (-),score=14.94 TRINITY_DN3285_c0_g3_i1:247-582(-)
MSTSCFHGVQKMSSRKGYAFVTTNTWELYPSDLKDPTDSSLLPDLWDNKVGEVVLYENPGKTKKHRGELLDENLSEDKFLEGKSITEWWGDSGNRVTPCTEWQISFSDDDE